MLRTLFVGVLALYNFGLTVANPITAAGCVSSCDDIERGFYHSCTTCKNFVACTAEGMYVMNCPADLEWDDFLNRCEWKSKTCGLVFANANNVTEKSEGDSTSVEAPTQFFDEQLMLDHPELFLKDSNEVNFHNLKDEEEETSESAGSAESEESESEESTEEEEEEDNDEDVDEDVEEEEEEEKVVEEDYVTVTEAIDDDVTEEVTTTDVVTVTEIPTVETTKNEYAHLPFDVRKENAIKSDFIAKAGICSVKSGGAVTTFDNFEYEFGGTCKYVVSRDCDGSQLMVEAGFKVDKSHPKRVVVDYIDINAQGVWVRLHSMILAFINGFAVPFGKTGTLDGIVAQTNTHNATMTTSGGVEATLDDKGEFFIYIPETFDHMMCGLCGNKDGNPDDDVINEPDDFANGYKSDNQDNFMCI